MNYLSVVVHNTFFRIVSAKKQHLSFVNDFMSGLKNINLYLD